MSPHRPGRRHRAEAPGDIPTRGWVQIVKRSWHDTQTDQVPLLAAGVAFYAFLALFPSMIAGAMIYGLVADAGTVARQARAVTAALPREAADLITTQMRTITQTSDRSLSLGLVVALALAVWSGSGGVGHVVTALNIAYDEEETRSFLQRKKLALALTLGAIVFVGLALALVAAAPAVLRVLVPDGALLWALQAARWALLVVIVAVLLAVLYHYAPDHDSPRFRWVSAGAAVATPVWVAASAVFSLWVDLFGTYGRTYGTLAGVVVLMLWLWITSFIVLFGAEINAEAETATATAGSG